MASGQPSDHRQSQRCKPRIRVGEAESLYLRSTMVQMPEYRDDEELARGSKELDVHESLRPRYPILLASHAQPFS